MKNIFKFTPPNDTNAFTIKKPTPPKAPKYDKNELISKDYSRNLEIMHYFMHFNLNSDIKFREFEIEINQTKYKAFLVFYDGMSESQFIDEYILRQLMIPVNTHKDNSTTLDIIRNSMISQDQISEATSYSKVIDNIIKGECALFVNTINICILCDVKSLPQRSVAKSENEMSVRGPAESFTEIIRTNTALIRKFVKDEDLIFEDITVGKQSKTTCSIAYISSITNESLIEEVKRRISEIEVDYLLDAGELEQLIEDKTYIINPLIFSTERPDKVASLLFEGRVAILVAGSPDVMIVPAIFSDFMRTAEDNYIRYPYSILHKLFRIPALLLAILLPGIYIAITTFHQEMIPTDLLFAIAAAREEVPFSIFIELLIMEIAFEIIREASIRTPAPIGPTLGIVGTLILGQAIVGAKIVSPVLIIIVALTGISSFAVANFYLNYTFRILRFVYIFLGAFAGLFGISLGIFVHLCILSSATSFGVPYLSPYSKLGRKVFKSDLFPIPIWKQEKRPSFLRPKQKEKQPKISRGWLKN